MFILKVSVIIFILFCIEAEARKIVPSFTKHMSNFKKDLVFGYTFEENLTFYYLYCDRHEDNPKKIACALTLEILSSDGQKNEKTCYVKIPVKKRQGAFNRKHTLSFYDSNKIILAWSEGEAKNRTRQRRFDLEPMIYFEELIRVRVYHMPSCKFKGRKIVADERDTYGTDVRLNNLNIVPYTNSTFDLFFRNERLCGKDRRCRFRYNSKNRKFDKRPVPWLPVAYDSTAEIYPIILTNRTHFDTISTVEAYIVQSRLQNDGNISLIDPRENILFNHEFSWSLFEIPIRVSNLATSSQQVTFGLCLQGMFESSVDCSLFDRQGNATLGINVSLETNDVEMMRMRNLPGGGFALFVKYAKKDTLLEYVILKISSEGDIEDVHEIRGIECTMEEVKLDMGLYERDGFDYCYYVACIWPRIWGFGEIEHKLQFFHECRSIGNASSVA